ncbi:MULTISPECIES: hypothetical protein [unclassified Sulfuricurvum]|uniref:hypothetical protein n=1 Tax=unclassified Sulfuricurvum TaxID=2632390 RepID=UPI0002997004|nr:MULTISPECIES: hypothetical protein [unclassified Sulfuricurvum]AFV96451.1 hypothetical protein B649_00685 [Candidatus Sulfuricurvum sp. RIFRC-1]HBM35909.1 hypothetical protein [Sulfuricurvum sp.]
MGSYRMNIAVVSYDAGSSEILCALIREYFEHASWHIFAIPQSPMGHICKRYNLPFTPVDDPQKQLRSINPDMLLFGTGWQDKIERPYVTSCKEKGIPTVAILDHWSNYRERFGFPDIGWEENLGDFTAVSDEKALSLAQSFNFPNPIALPNFYLRDMINQARQKEPHPNNNLLFLSEPTDVVALQTYGDKNYWGFTQYSALEDILKNFDRFRCAGLTIRLHPSDNGSGYKKILKSYPHIRVQINEAAVFDLNDQLLNAKMIIGFDTMALYIAALLERPVLSYLPSKNRNFLLPIPRERQVRILSNIPSEILSPSLLHIDDFGMDFALFLKTIYVKELYV